jgi:hypothetical protein
VIPEIKCSCVAYLPPGAAVTEVVPSVSFTIHTGISIGHKGPGVPCPMSAGATLMEDGVYLVRDPDVESVTAGVEGDLEVLDSGKSRRHGAGG